MVLADNIVAAFTGLLVLVGSLVALVLVSSHERRYRAVGGGMLFSALVGVLWRFDSLGNPLSNPVLLVGTAVVALLVLNPYTSERRI